MVFCSRASLRRASVVVLAVAALVAGLGSAPAQGAVAMSGSVVIPSDYRSGDGSLYVEVRDADERWTILRQGEVTPASPTFSFSGLLSGHEYVVGVSDGSGQLESGLLADRESGRLSDDDDQAVRLDGSVSGLVLRPTMLPSIHGKVLAPPGSAEVVTGRVVAWQIVENGVRQGGGSVEIEDGTFRIVGLEPGSYTLHLETTARGLLTGWYTTRRTGLAARETEATPVQAGGSPVVLRPRRSAAMSGRVTVPEGLDPQSIHVDVRAAVRSPYGADEFGSGSAQVEQDGTFIRTGLDPEMHYTVGWSGDGIADQFLGVTGEPVPTRAAAEVLRPRKSVAIQAAAPATIRGKVVPPLGVSATPRGSVGFVPEGDGLVTGGAFSVSQDGSFTLGDFAPGEMVQLDYYDDLNGWNDGWYVGNDRNLVHDPDRAGYVRAGSNDVVLRPSVTMVEGRVSLPSAYAGNPTDLVVYVESVRSDDVAGARRLDGSAAFAVQLNSWDAPFRLRLADPSGTLREGYLSPEGELVADEGDARPLTGQTTGLVIPGDVPGDIVVDLRTPSLANSATVVAVDVSGRVAARADWREGAPAVLTGLATGRQYGVQVSGSGLATAWYAGEGSPSVALRSRAASVTVGEQVTVQVVAPGAIRGTLSREHEGHRVTIDLIDAATGELVARSTTSDELFQDFLSVVPGTYVLGLQRAASTITSTTPYAAAYVGPGGTSVASFESAVRFTVSNGRLVNASVTATGCASLAGFVDEQVADQDVQLRLWGEDLPQRTWFSTDGSTEFFVDGLAVGRYHVGLRVGESDEVLYDDVTIDGCRAIEGVAVGSQPAVHATTPPVLVGEATVDATLSVEPVEWSHPVDAVTYQWFAGPRPIDGAHGSSYQVRPADLGSRVSVRVTARRSGLQDGAEELASESVVSRASLGTGSVVLPTAARLGSPITARAAGWSGARIEWQWTRDGWPIAGATSAEYLPVRGDEGHRLQAIAYAARPGYTPTSAVSEPVVPSEAFVLLTAPQLSPDPQVGTRVVASRGTWTLAPDSVAYQWLRNGAAIQGATRAAYVPVAADHGAKLQVCVTAKRAGFPTRVALSAKRTVAAGVIRSSRAPRLYGSARVGDVLYSDGGVWSPGGVTRTYQWLRNGVPVAGARAARYELKQSDKGAQFQLKVVASKPGYRSAAAVSAESAPVQ